MWARKQSHANGSVCLLLKNGSQESWFERLGLFLSTGQLPHTDHNTNMPCSRLSVWALYLDSLISSVLWNQKTFPVWVCTLEQSKLTPWARLGFLKNALPKIFVCFVEKKWVWAIEYLHLSEKPYSEEFWFFFFPLSDVEDPTVSDHTKENPTVFGLVPSISQIIKHMT